MQRLIRRDEDGAVAVIVALLLGAVLLAMGALVIDVGTLYAERRELQNGADFAALTVAADCAAGSAGCPASVTATAEQYADANAKDNQSNVDDVCGTAPALAPCSPKQGPWDCDPATGTADYVQVRTSTLTGGGGTLMPPLLSRTLAGNAADPGHQVRACARAAYGGVASASALALTVSLCEWQAATSGGTVFAPQPPYPPNPSTSFERAIYLHTTTAVTCGGGPSGWDLPGGFGWLDDTTGSCSGTVDVDGIYNDNTGVPASGPCKTALAEARSGRYTIYLPVFDGVNNQGSNGTYHLKGFAAFVVTGYYLPGLRAKSWLSGRHLCSGANKCIYGFFTQGLVPGGSIGPSTLPGVWTTQLSG